MSLKNPVITLLIVLALFVSLAAPASGVSRAEVNLVRLVGIPWFWMPVYGVGEGVDTPIGSLAHRGPDLYAIDYEYDYEGMDIYPALAGRVVYSDCAPDYGCTVVIRHWDDSKWDKKYYSVYAHLLDEGRPAKGTLIEIDDVIGHMGATGSGSNGIVHLHFAVRASTQALEGTSALYGIGQQAFNVRPHFKSENNAQPHEPMDLDRYCRDKFGGESLAVAADIYDALSWYCERNNRYAGSIDMDEVCQTQYPQAQNAAIDDFDNAFSWYCTW